MNYRIWFSLIAVFLLGGFYATAKPKTETEGTLFLFAAWTLVYLIYLFASHKKAQP